MRTFAVSDLVLHVTAAGMTGAHAIMCALGLDRLPGDLEATFERGEWVDLVAKARGMRHADTLYRLPITRQVCGCHVAAEPVSNDDSTAAVVSVWLCDRHRWHHIPNGTDPCALCGHPRGRHPFRHRFKAAIESDVPPSNQLPLGTLSYRR